MSDEPVNKPIPKFLDAKKILRPISSGYKLEKDLPPEVKRNMPTEIAKNNHKENNKLNIEAPSFYPKNKKHNQGENKVVYTKKNNINYPRGKNFNNNNQQYYQSNMNTNNAYNFNTPYGFANNQAYPMTQAQMAYQQNYYLQQSNPMYMNNSNSMINNNYGYPMNNNNYVYFEQMQNRHYNMNNSQPSAPTPLAPQNKPPNKQNTSLKLGNTYIPKSMRENTNTNTNTNTNKPTEEQFNLNLNLNAESYTPQNENLKKKEEQIQKKKEEIKKEETKEEITKEEEKKEEKNKKKAKEGHKGEEKSDEQKTKQKEENAEQQKKKSKLAALLDSTNNEHKKNKDNQKNTQSENAPTYRPKKKNNMIEKKISEFNTKEKKFKDMEEKKKEEKKKKKEEEEKQRKMEEKQRKIEEKQIKEEEEKKKKKEEEEMKRKEEEEKKRKEEEEKKRREEEEKKRKEEEEKKRKKEEEKKRKEEEEKKKKEEEEKKRKEEERKQKEEEERKQKEEDEKNKVIEKKYFIVFKNKKSEKKEYKYTFEYIMQFKDWKISNETDLLTENAKKHFEDFNEEEREGGKKKKRDDGKTFYNNKQTNSKGINYAKIQVTKEETNSSPAPVQENSMEQWARKDMTKEIKAAEEFKHKLEETIKDDPIKRNLRGYLNMLTKDNYEETKSHILSVIKDNVDYQVKFLDVLFQKAVMERAYVELYAKLCKDLDKELPQKNKPKEGKEGEKKTKSTSVMRAKLLDKCREIFQIKNNEKFDEYIKEKDPIERENKLKKFILGNVYFITELIKIKILSKKIAPVCIKNLFERYESLKSDEKLKLINLEAIVIFTDQFGSLVHSQEKKIDSKDAKSFKERIDEIFQKLDKIKDEPGLPGYIKYKIINLIEKRKNNYQKTKYEEYMIAKSKKEVEKELENQEQITQDTINEKMKRGLTDYRDFVEEEGNSDKYPWKETTYLYDKKEKSLDDILEGYIVACGDFIEKKDNIKFAKDYIRELIVYYHNIEKKEKKELRNRLFKLLELVRDFALETPAIYDVYAYIIYIFIINDIMDIKDLKEIIKENDSTPEDYTVISSILKMTYEYYKLKKFKKELENFEFIKKNPDLFDWVFITDDKTKEEEEEEENDED